MAGSRRPSPRAALALASWKAIAGLAAASALCLSAWLGAACSGAGRDGPCRDLGCGVGFCFSDGQRAYCACPPGFAPYDDGPCGPVEGCEGISCSGHGECVEVGGRAEGCSCAPGFRPSPDGFHCLPDSPAGPDGDGDVDGDGDGDVDGDGDGDIDGDGDRDAEADADADEPADADPEPDGDAPGRVGFVAQIGSATCGATSTTVAVDAPVPSRETIVVRIGVRDGRTDHVLAVADSRGNPFRLDARSEAPGQCLVEVWSAPVLTALSAGDVITVTHPAIRSVAVVAERFEGLAAREPVEGLDARSGSTASLEANVVTSTAPTLLYAAAANVAHATLAHDAPFLALLRLHASCGPGITGDATDHGAWAVAADPGEQRYAATLSADAQWALVLVAYPTAP